jgi:hypothetical protein
LIKFDLIIQKQKNEIDFHLIGHFPICIDCDRKRGREASDSEKAIANRNQKEG